MTAVEIDILEIKQILHEMKKSIEKIENALRDDYLETQHADAL